MIHRIRLVAVVLSGLGGPAVADILNVPSLVYPTIQAAIDAAVNGDEVVVADGTYAGPGNVNLDFGGRWITVRSASGDPTLCIIDCEGSGRGFYFHSGETSRAVVEGFTITGGNAVRGGGMTLENSEPTVINCTFSGNSASTYGGGMWNSFSDPRVTNCTFSGNTAGCTAVGCTTLSANRR